MSKVLSSLHSAPSFLDKGWGNQPPHPPRPALRLKRSAGKGTSWVRPGVEVGGLLEAEILWKFIVLK